MIDVKKKEEEGEEEKSTKGGLVAMQSGAWEREMRGKCGGAIGVRCCCYAEGCGKRGREIGRGLPAWQQSTTIQLELGEYELVTRPSSATCNVLEVKVFK